MVDQKGETGLQTLLQALVHLKINCPLKKTGTHGARRSQMGVQESGVTIEDKAPICHPPFTRALAHHQEDVLNFTCGVHVLGTISHNACRAYFWVGSQGLNSFRGQSMNLLLSSCDLLTPQPLWEDRPED